MNRNETYILNPDYSFNVDQDRIVMYSKKTVQDYSSSDWISFVHPVQACILNKFIEPHTISEHCDNLAAEYGITVRQAYDMVLQYIENQKPIFTEFEEHKIFFPKNVLIPIGFVKDEELSARRESDIEISLQHLDLTPDRMHSAPQSLLFMLTAKCATKCKYCYADKNTKYKTLSTEKILEIIEEAHALKMTHIDIIGGEVFCCKDWDIILKRLVEYDMCPNFISTKYPLTEEMVKKLHYAKYNNVVQVSLDSLNPIALEETIGVKLDYVDKIKKAISYLEKYKFKIQINTILIKSTAIEAEIERLYNYIKSIKGLIYWEIRAPEKSIYSTESYESVKASREQLENIYKFIRTQLLPKAEFKIICSDEILNEHLKDGKPTDEYFVGGTCGILQNRAFVLPDGKVSICELMYWHPQFIIGDLKKQSIQEVWNSSKAKELFCMHRKMFREQSSCHNCKVLDFCNQKHRRCFVKIIRAYGEENWDYPDPRCQFAPEISPQY